jgi:molybdopterin synthase catalytic subunit
MSAMHVKVRYFAVVRERLRAEEEPLELPDGATVEQAMATLCERHPAVRELRPHLLIALNQEFVTAGVTIRDGDEIALIPPVAGGSGLYRISEQALSVDEALRAVAGGGMGGIVTFVGTVRASSGGRAVERLEYEAFAEMATSRLRQIGEDLAGKHGAKLAILHRVGSLSVGEVAVVIAAAAPHRAEAFAACREAIERLKVEVPIWKKEHGVDGAVWVGLGP